MAEIAKLDNLSIDDLASLWNVNTTDITKVMGLDVVSEELTAGSSETFESDYTKNITVTKMDATHAIVSYTESNTIAKAVCLSLSGTTITAGSPTTFHTGDYGYYNMDATAMDDTHVIVVWRDGHFHLAAICLVLSGTSISHGAPNENHNDDFYQPVITAMDNTHAVCNYKDYSNNDKGKAFCITLSGTSIGFESTTSFESGSVSSDSSTTMDSTHAIVTYSDSDDGRKGKAVCLTRSGTTINNHTPTIFDSIYVVGTSVTTIDSNHAIVVYSDYDNNRKGKAVLLTLSGATISVGTPITFEPGSIVHISATTINNNNVLVVYRDYNTNEGKAVILTLSGTTITVGTPIIFESGYPIYNSITTMDSIHAIVAYRAGDNNDKGKAVCITFS